MTVAVRLLATVAAPQATATADAPEVLPRSDRRLLAQRGDDEVVVQEMGVERGAEVRFPAPWPRGFGSVAVSPDGGAVVFAGLHAVRCVDAAGATRWEVRHGCWSSEECSEMHMSFDEYADDQEHEYPDSGSAAFSTDGKLVWAHVRGPLAGGDGEGPGDEEADAEDDQADELWLVLDAAQGRVLGSAETGTVGSASFHTLHPDPARMGLSIGEGEEGSPVLWGWWDGQRLSAQKIDDELILLAVSPSGRYLLTVDIGQYTLSLHSEQDGSVLRELDADGSVPQHPESSGGDRVYWDFEGAFVDEDTVVAGTSGSDSGYSTARHWLVDARTMTLRGRISYPFPVSGPARSAGDGAWYTVAADRTAVHLWRLADEA